MSDTPIPTGTEGKAVFKHGQDQFYTWYTTYGDLKSSEHTPLVLLHGGPGSNHYGMLSCYDLYAQFGIPLVFYDQLGSSNSYEREWNLEDKPLSFWNHELHIDELLNLVRHLGIEDKFNLLGHSWGAMMVTKTAAQRKPKGLRKIVAADGTNSMKLFVEETRKLIDKLPAEYRDAILKHEADGTTDHPDFKKAASFFVKRHVNRLDVLPDMLKKMVEVKEKNKLVYSRM